MNYESEASEGEAKFFRASKARRTNICGATVGGVVSGAVMLVIAVSILWGSPEFNTRFIGAALLLVIFATFWGMYPGNWIASAPYAVKMIEGKGLWLHAFLKKV